MATINGTVTIGVSETPGKATVLLFNESGDTLVATTTSDPSTGTYAFTGVPDGMQYRIVVLGDNEYRSRAYGPCIVGDPYWNQVVTLLHLDGTDGAISFTDERSKTWSASGNAQIDESQSKFGVSSLLLDGTGDLISTADHSDWSFASGNFTVECFVRFNALSGSAVFAGHYNITGNQREWLFWHDVTNGLLSFTYSTDGSSAPAIQHAWSPVVNTWYHVAVSRVGNTLYLFVDGALIGSSSFNFTLFGSSASLTVGHANTSALALNGWIDEFRITKGVGRYSAAFTAPISPFSNTTEHTARIALPLTYDEDDYNGLLTWTRSGGGGGPHITPQGMYGNGYDAKYKATSLPSWLSTAATDLLLHASITLRPNLTAEGSGAATGDMVVHVGNNDATADSKMSLRVARDTMVSSIPVVRLFYGAGGTQTLARRGWKYQGRVPELASGPYGARPQAFLFLDANTYLLTVHFEDTVSRCYKVDVSTGNVLGQFDFPSPYVHVATAAMREDGTIWFSDYATHKVLRVNVPASLTAGTAQIDGVYNTSVVTGAGAIEWARLGASNAEYLILADYQFSGSPYLYLIPAASVVLGNTFAASDRYKRFVCDQNLQGITYYGGKAYATNNRLTADGAGSNIGKIVRINLSSQADSLADGGTLVAEAVTYAPSGMPEDLDFHPSTGHCWVPTEGYASVIDQQGFIGLWSGPNDGTEVENHYTAFYDYSAGTIELRINNKPFQSVSGYTATLAPSCVTIGGHPTFGAGTTNGYTTATVRNIVIADPVSMWSSSDYQLAVTGGYEPNTLTTYTVTITNPGAESGTTGWTNETGGIAARSTDPSPHTGTAYFSGGANAATKSRQRFSIATATGLTTTQIDAGGMWARTAWWQASWFMTGFADDTDVCSMGLRTLDGTPTQIAESVGGKVTLGLKMTWVPRWHSLSIASGSRNLDLLYDATRNVGTNLDGYVDDVELVFYRQ